jgi:hypothetical protein
MLATGIVVVQTPVQAAYDFVLDPARYPQADTKITRMRTLWRDGDELMFSIGLYLWSSLLESNLIVRARLQPQGIRLQSESISFPASMAVREFKAEFQFEATESGTLVRHTESYVTKDAPLGRLLERRGDEWLKHHMEQIKMPRLKTLLEDA